MDGSYMKTHLNTTVRNSGDVHASLKMEDVTGRYSLQIRQLPLLPNFSTAI